MTGRPDHNAPAFAELAVALRVSGYRVVSPIEETLAKWGTWENAVAQPHGEHLLHDLGILAGKHPGGPIDAVAVMDDWMESVGSRREVSWALDYGIPIYDARMRLLHVEESFAVRPVGSFRDGTYSQLLRLVDGTEGGDVVHGDFPDHAGMSVDEDLPAWDTPATPVDPAYGAVVADKSGAVKADGGKARMDLLARESLVGTAEVLGFGAAKYADHNWRKGFAWSRIYGAALRHLTAWFAGEDLDDESGLSHLDHAACCLMFLQTYVKTSTGTDDRYKKEA